MRSEGSVTQHDHYGKLERVPAQGLGLRLLWKRWCSKYCVIDWEQWSQFTTHWNTFTHTHQVPLCPPNLTLLWSLTFYRFRTLISPRHNELICVRQDEVWGSPFHGDFMNTPALLTSDSLTEVRNHAPKSSAAFIIPLKNVKVVPQKSFCSRVCALSLPCVYFQHL